MAPLFECGGPHEAQRLEDGHKRPFIWLLWHLDPVASPQVIFGGGGVPRLDIFERALQEPWQHRRVELDLFLLSHH